MSSAPNPKFSKYPQAIAASAISPIWQAWSDSFLRAVAARNRSANTIRSYRVGLDAFGRYLAANTITPDIQGIRARDLEAFLLVTKESHSASTVVLFHLTLKLFFNWLVDEEELATSPMAKMRNPSSPESTRGALRDGDVRKLLKACEGNDFAARRDLALVRLFLDTGLRLSELVLIDLGDINFKDQTITVMGKGNRPRVVPFGKKASAALDRYLRARLKEPKAAGTDRVWLSQRGPLHPAVAREYVRHRARAAGIPEVIHPHLLRHTFAHYWLESGGQEGDLKAIGGWKSDVMYRYGKNLAQDRAREAHKRHSPGDRF
jgi:site-specific recombinase XerD